MRCSSGGSTCPTSRHTCRRCWRFSPSPWSGCRRLRSRSIGTGIDDAIMKRSTLLLIVIGLIGMPAVLTAVEARAYYAANRSTNTLVSSGLTREYTLHVPPQHDGKTPMALVISMHGAAMWPAAQQDTTQWNRVADR